MVMLDLVAHEGYSAHVRTTEYDESDEQLHEALEKMFQAYPDAEYVNWYVWEITPQVSFYTKSGLRRI